VVQAGEDGPDLGGDVGKYDGMIAVPDWIADMSDMKISAVTNLRITSNARAVRRER